MYNDRKRGASALPMQRKNSPLAARTHREEDSPIFKKIMICSLMGLAAIFVTGVLLVTVTTMLASAASDPLSLIPSLALASLLPANFIGGFLSAKKCGEASAVCGIVTAAMWCAVSLTLALCLYSAPSSGYGFLQGLLLHGLSALFCILGALAGGIKRKPSHKKRRFG